MVGGETYGRAAPQPAGPSLLSSLNARFLALASLAAIAVIAFAIVSHQGLSQLAAANGNIRTIAQIVQRHMDADMKHDAIHFDVLGGKLATVEKQSSEFNEHQKDFQDDIEDFRKDVEANLHEDMPAEITAKLRDVATGLTAYEQAGRTVFDALAKGEDSAAAMAAFQESFEFLEKANAAVSESLLAWAERSNTESDRLASRTGTWITILAAITLVLALATPFYAAFGVFLPLRKAIETATEIAGGRADVSVPYIGSRNEMGEIARCIDVFRRNLLNIREMADSQRRQQQVVEAEKRQAMKDLAGRFEARVQTIITAVASAAGDLLGSARTMTDTIGVTSERATHAASESRGTEQNVQAVAAAVEEMSSAAREIANQIVQSGAVVRSTVSRVDTAEATSAQLADANAKIGNIVALIRDITGQINLLALNATIESARAGEAGKGFAVVANEVKNLASQTSKATEQIAEQITQVQDVSRDVVQAFSSIKQLIGHVEQYASTVAAAAEEQTATTNEIASNMTSTARGTSQIAQHIGDVVTASKDANSAALQVLDAAKIFSDQAVKLRSEVEAFLDEVQAA